MIFFEDYEWILASNSPARLELLQSLGVKKITVKPTDIEENFPADFAACEVPRFLAEKKTEAFGVLSPKQLLITADTAVIFKQKIYNKPKDKQEAKFFLNQFSGQMHEVITGICLSTCQKKIAFEVSTKVYFSKLSEQNISFYIEHFSPYNKAGGYGIQDWMGKIGIEKIEGDFYNVMGLPLQKICQYLEILERN